LIINLDIGGGTEGGHAPQLSAYRGLPALAPPPTGAWISGHCAAVPTTRRDFQPEIHQIPFGGRSPPGYGSAGEL